MQPPAFSDQGLHVMSKPIGPICNLDCEYCYYLHKEDLYPSGQGWRMGDETLEAYVAQYIDAQPAGASEITFAWQGGEPTLLGVEFFERIVALQRRYAPRGKRIVNSLQTNGVLLDEAWCRFFREHDFLIGISIDGPAELHDRYRYDKKGRGTFAAVLEGLKLLKTHQVQFNVLTVVNRHNGDHGRRVYSYLRDCGAEFIQFIPIVEPRGVGRHAETGDAPMVGSDPLDGIVSSRSVRPEQFGRFLIDVFDEWSKRDIGRVFVQVFDQALSAWMGIEPSLCIFRKQCGRALAIEHNGDLYSCDHFVEPDYLLGNIRDLPIVEMANSPRQEAFARDKETSLPQYCLDCDVRFACNGGCPKNRFIETPAGEPGLNYLCKGYRKFFAHIDRLMREMVVEVKAGRPAANVMQRARGKQPIAAPMQRTQNVGRSRPAAPPGRNDLCPCGSGRKYKKCCLSARNG